MVSRCSERWVHHLADPHDGIILGVTATDVPANLVPGRVALARGRDVAEAHVALLDPASLRARPDRPRVERVGTLPSTVDAARCTRPRRHDGLLTLPVGLRFDDLHDATLDVPDGDHVVVIGPGRSGRSTVLSRLVHGWRLATPDGWVGVVTPRRSPLSPLGGDATCVVAGVPVAGPALLVVDDAELVEDPTGALSRLVAGRRSGLLVVIAGRPESLRAAYGHWSSGVRRSRLGVVMTGSTDMDADLLGATLPRWPPIPPRPGLAYLVADGTATLAQCAIDPTTPGTAAPGTAARRRTGAHSLAAVS
jgi:S-DNA-T family DNA segregation ATPase FtsK/SpoIIIE